MKRLKSSLFACRMLRHFKQKGWIWILCIGLFLMASERFHIAINRTHSLPYKLFVIDKKSHPEKLGQYVAFLTDKKATGGFELMFVKQIACLPGQDISVNGQSVYCDSTLIAQAKLTSLKGEPLKTIAQQTVAPNHYFVKGTHPDSYDSRYESFGLIAQERFVGQAYPLF